MEKIKKIKQQKKREKAKVVNSGQADLELLQALKKQQDLIFQRMANLLGVLSAPARLQLIHFLSQAPLSVDVLAAKIQQSIANTSLHLKKMQSAKIVDVQVAGQRRIYHLHENFRDLWESCLSLLPGIDSDLSLQVDKVYGDIHWPHDISLAQKMLQKKEAVLVDVRPPDEQIFPSENHDILTLNILDLDPKKTINLPKKVLFIFCRGPICAMSAHATSLLRKKGFSAYRLPFSIYNLFPKKE